MEYMGYELTPQMSEDAYKRDKAELMKAFNPRYVTVTEETPPAGCLGLIKITVNSRSYILTGEEDLDPKLVDKPYFYMKVFKGYPAIAPKVYFPENRRIAHVNTFRKGTQCIDTWGKYSSLKNTAEKTIRAAIFDENVTKYESPACSALEKWQKAMARKNAFPMLNPPDLILRDERGEAAVPSSVQLPPPLPGRRPAAEPRRTPLPPPLPGRG
ncbi:MAG: hypothetical protein IKJ99_09750 [Oscillospiraceae bacterium]|nr:hypothetical protein [Oscillospiraceae bacterium]